MIGQNDPVDEVQGFLFGKLKQVLYFFLTNMMCFLYTFGCSVRAKAVFCPVTQKEQQLCIIAYKKLGDQFVVAVRRHHAVKLAAQFEGNLKPDELILFVFFKYRTVHPELKEQLKELRKHLVESTNEMAPLKVWQMQGEYIKRLSVRGDAFQPEFGVFKF